MTISVLVPTYRRPERLAGCLDAIVAQRRPAQQVVVICRAGDVATLAVVHSRLAALPCLQVVTVNGPGVIAAMAAGLAIATGDLTALTDDDAAPWPDWLERIEQHFLRDPHLGGLGGRDWQYKGVPPRLDDGRETRAGELQWWGRIIGQHHWAVPGPPRDVVVVKGVNCAYRTDLLRQIGGFDSRLAGAGAQVHWELSLGLAVLRAGRRLVFDPALGVDHFIAERFDVDQRGQFDPTAQRNAVFNETLVLAEHLPPTRRLVFWAWAYLVGTGGAPGLLQAVRLWIAGIDGVIPRLAATFHGRSDGFREARFASAADRPAG